MWQEVGDKTVPPLSCTCTLALETSEPAPKIAAVFTALMHGSFYYKCV